MKKNIVLVGFMGTGKSTITKILAELLGWKSVSTDEMVVKKEGRSINDIFKESSEAYFRECEHQAVLEVAQYKDVIIDCGGGVVLNPANMKALKQSGVVVHLSCEPKEILRRVNLQPKRPLLDVEDPLSRINEMLNERAPYYHQADFSIDTSDGDLHKAAKEIIKRISND